MCIMDYPKFIVSNQKEESIRIHRDNWFEPVHDISNNMVCATSKASDQPAHTRSLIRAFARRLNILWVLSYWPNIFWRF